ncbi:hypothetical protein Pla123a_43850 [Posidoniimonas polymericola]|uniref:Uncharacterized protein n=2 Tax=Posidoniimonas polymericola TaxID=2528002 RepID=A0A5C5XUH9_9BACT|nr:hypothetical protein Pla123a_43850 [Posidoniimonas polymericola]
MAKHEKSLKAPVTKSFDFLDGEVERLKDIGQPDSALLAACRFDELAQGLRATDQMLVELRATTSETASTKGMEKGAVDDWVEGATLSVLAYYFVEGLLEGERPLKMDGMFAHCRDGMQKYFETVNEIRTQRGEESIPPHEPVFVNYSEQPIVIKP